MVNCGGLVSCIMAQGQRRHLQFVPDKPGAPPAPIMVFRNVDFDHPLDQGPLHSQVAVGYLCATLKLHWSFPQLSGVWLLGYYDHCFSPIVPPCYVKIIILCYTCILRYIFTDFLWIGGC